MSVTIFKMTAKQIEIMNLILAGDPRDGFLDIDQLWDRLSYRDTASKQAVQCSIRFLEGHAMLSRSRETRRKRCRVVLTPTKLGLDTFKGSVAADFGAAT